MSAAIEDRSTVTIAIKMAMKILAEACQDDEEMMVAIGVMASRMLESADRYTIVWWLNGLFRGLEEEAREDLHKEMASCPPSAGKSVN